MVILSPESRTTCTALALEAAYASAATALVAAKKAWDAGGDADAFARAKVKVLAGAA